jgi:hypothetical protein
MCINENNRMRNKWIEREDQWTQLHTFDQPKINIICLIDDG